MFSLLHNRKLGLTKFPASACLSQHCDERKLGEASHNSVCSGPQKWKVVQRTKEKGTHLETRLFCVQIHLEKETEFTVNLHQRIQGENHAVFRQFLLNFGLRAPLGSKLCWPH